MTYEEGELFAKENNMAFLETSAKQNEHVDEVNFVEMNIIQIYK